MAAASAKPASAEEAKLSKQLEDMDAQQAALEKQLAAAGGSRDAEDFLKSLLFGADEGKLQRTGHTMLPSTIVSPNHAHPC